METEISGISEEIHEYDLNSLSPLKSFHDFSEQQLREMFALLVHRLMEDVCFWKARICL